MILIPCAGDGARFQKAGYSLPKHQLPLNGKPMIQWVRENVEWLDPEGETFIATKDVV